MSAASMSAMKLVATAVMKPDEFSVEKAEGAAETNEIRALALYSAGNFIFILFGLKALR